MLKKILFFLFILNFTFLILHSTLLEVSLDGSQPFTSIQSAINASTNGDTVLVHPGIYYENIDYLGKSLTVASLYLITPEDSLIHQTIIDGNQQYRCVTIDDCVAASLIGFTIQNGNAYMENSQVGSSGGGVFVQDVQYLFLSDCYIINNIALYCGGVYLKNVSSFLSNNTISQNWGILTAGGVGITGNSTFTLFDDIELNSIFLNYSSWASDVFIASNVPEVVNIIVDTLTTANPDFFFISSLQYCTISYLHTAIDQIDQDLYVSPDGDDNNSGSTPDDPLQTIAWAQTLIKRNDENPHIIHLASGTYSASLNNQKFPLNIKQGVKYVGISPQETILDAEYIVPFFFHLSRNEGEFANLNMTKLKLINGYWEVLGGGISIYNADLNLNEVTIENCNGFPGSAILVENGICRISDSYLINNLGEKAAYMQSEYGAPNPVLDVIITNTIIANNNPSDNPDEGSGGALAISGHNYIPGEYKAKLINCEISNNHDSFYNPLTGLGGSAGLYASDNLVADIVNCTFSGNTLSANTGCVMTVNNSQVNLYNTILYDNDGYSFNLWENAQVSINNSLIEGGNNNVNYYYPLAYVDWAEGNLPGSANPLFDSSNEQYPYTLSANSPCIDAGTLNLPEGVELPEYDLVGNPRIHGDSIDMGAYEYQGTPVQELEIENVKYKINIFPNPLSFSGNQRTECNIWFEVPKEGKAEVAIYNIKGQRVKTILDAYTTQGEHFLKWDGRDDFNKPVASGNYMLSFKQGDIVRVQKMVVVK